MTLSNARGFFAPASDATFNTETLRVGDTPKLPSTDTMVLLMENTITGDDVDGVDRFDLEIDFHIYFAARTTQRGAIYTQRAMGSWEFNGSGSVNENTKVWTAAQQAGNSVTMQFAEITSGETVPVASGEWINNIAQNLTWTTEPQ